MSYTGMQTIDWLYKNALSVDEEWSVRDEKGFVWWPHKHKQSISIVGEEVGGPGGEVGYYICIKTDLVKNLELNSDSLNRINLLLMSFASMAGPVYDEDARKLSLCSMLRVYGPISAWANSWLAAAAGLQACEAEIMAHEVAVMLNAQDDISAHPRSGMRKNPDEMLDVVKKIFSPQGKDPCRWEESEFEYVVQNYMRQPPAVRANSGGQSFVVEFPHGNFTSLCQAKGTEPHPRYGNGLFLLHSLPYAAETQDEGIRMALWFNKQELTKRPAGYGFGSYVYKDNCMHFTAFFPNALYGPGFLLNLYMTCAGRAAYASEILLAKSEHKAHVQNEEMGEDVADNEQGLKMHFATYGRSHAHEIGSHLETENTLSYEQYGSAIAALMAKIISVDGIEVIAREIGFDINPFFFAKRKKLRFAEEVYIVFTALTIISINSVFCEKEARQLIDAFLRFLNNNFFKEIEKIHRGFEEKYQKEIGCYFDSLKSSSSIADFPNIFVSNVGYDAVNISDALKFLSEKFSWYLEGMRVVLEDIKKTKSK